MREICSETGDTFIRGEVQETVKRCKESYVLSSNNAFLLNS